jgi:hypothetical protein
MSHDESNGQSRQPKSRKRKLWMLGVGLLAAFPVAALVFACVEKIQDASDRTK